MKRRMLSIVVASLFAAFSAACVAKNVVVKVSENEPNLKKDGVFYALPRTEIRAEIPVIKIEESKGKFQKFAICFFPEDGKKDHR